MQNGMRARVVAQFLTVATMAGTVIYGVGQAQSGSSNKSES